MTGDEMTNDTQDTSGGDTVTVSESAFATFLARMEPLPGSLRSDRALRAVAPEAGGTPEGRALEGRTSPGGDITQACITTVENLRGDITSLLSDLTAARTAYRDGQGRIQLDAERLEAACADADVPA
jgi:hypothetical protein